jgi:RecA-family ATPase
MKNNSNTDVKNVAKHYRDVLGFNVIPLKAGRKVPALPKGHPYLYRQGTDKEFESFDFRNVGIVTGQTSGIVVLDVDEEGPNTLREKDWTVPPTVTVKTMNGRHYYFRYPSYADRVPTKIGFANGLDFKADGGYVVAPPSVVERMVNEKGINWPEEHKYEWVRAPEDLGIAECPEWLLQAIRERSGASSVDFDWARALAGVPEGQRDNLVWEMAWRAAYAGLPIEWAERLVVEAADNCTPPFNRAVALEKVARAYETTTTNPPPTPQQPTETVGILMADVKLEQVGWLWDRRIPLGKLTLLEGDPDWGKSAITMDLAARVTTGGHMPHDTLDHVEPLDTLEPLDLLGGVIILNAEDGLGDTIRPRLEAAGADLTKVLALPPMKDDENIISIPTDIPLIEKAIERVGARLLIIDPLSAFMRGDPNKDSDVRKALTPLAKMAEHKDVAVLVVRHFNKNIDTRALYRGGGSIGIIGAARSALAVAQHPNDDELRVLVPQKSNLSKKAQSLSYTIVTAENGAARVEWKGTVDLNADELLNANLGELGRAKAWLADKLKNGPVLATEIEKQAREANISESTLKRAKAKLSVQSKKVGPNGEWRWHLAQEVQEGQGGQEVQEHADTENDCECGGRECLECLTQELPFDTT